MEWSVAGSGGGCVETEQFARGRAQVVGTGGVLLGRAAECEVLDHLVEAVRMGESRVLVIRGEAGIGKTALLEYLREQASGWLTGPGSWLQFEMELAFAALHQLCESMLDRLPLLPEPQRDACWEWRSGIAPDRRPIRSSWGSRS